MVQRRSSGRKRKAPTRLVDEASEEFIFQDSPPLQPLEQAVGDLVKQRVAVRMKPWLLQHLQEYVWSHSGCGCTLQVKWKEGWFEGLISRLDEHNQCKIDYDDGDVDEGVLGKDHLRIIDESGVEDKPWRLLDTSRVANASADAQDQAAAVAKDASAAPADVGSTQLSGPEHLGQAVAADQPKQALGSGSITEPPQPVSEPLPVGMTTGFPVDQCLFQASPATIPEGHAPAESGKLQLEDQPLQSRLASPSSRNGHTVNGSQERQTSKGVSKRKADNSALPGAHPNDSALPGAHPKIVSLC